MELSERHERLDPRVQAELEATLRRIPGVNAVRVVLEAGTLTEIHVLARPGRGPKQLVRDVQSVVLAHFGIDVDYRKISVVQLAEITSVQPDEEPPAPAPAARRIELAGVTWEVTGARGEARVRLDVNGREVTGVARGAASNALTLGAKAVLDAAAGLFEDAWIELDGADVVEVNGEKLVVVAARMITRKDEHVLSGTAVVRYDLVHSSARACLAALDRVMDGQPV